MPLVFQFHLSLFNETIVAFIVPCTVIGMPFFLSFLRIQCFLHSTNACMKHYSFDCNKVYFQLLPRTLRGMRSFYLAQCNKNGTCVCHCADCFAGCQSCSPGWSGSTENFCQKGTDQLQSMRKKYKVFKMAEP